MTFYSVLKQSHSLLAIIAIVLLCITVIFSITGFYQKKEYTVKNFRMGLFTLTVTHLQLLLGLILYFTSPLFSQWSALGGKVMKDAYLRKMLVEHPFGVILGITLITIGWVLHKKQKTSQKAFGKIALFFALGLICILSVIPWGTWF